MLTVKTKIDKTLVKSVYTDVLHEHADSGLIVTTSYLSSGAARMRTARGYKVDDLPPVGSLDLM
jgi:restriction system protein